MKRLLGLIPVLFSALAVFLAVGCEDEEGPPAPQILGQVIVTVGEDTLCFVPGDTASTTVTVEVKDTRGRGMPGVKVNVALDDSVYSWLEFEDSLRRDTTDALGQVNLMYYTIAPGTNRIRAIVGTDTGFVQVIHAPSDWVPGLVLALSQRHIHLSSSDTVTARFTNRVTSIFSPCRCPPPREEFP